MIRVAWPTLGHNWSWDDNQFVLEALSRGGELLKEVLPKGFADSAEAVFDDGYG